MSRVLIATHQLGRGGISHVVRSIRRSLTHLGFSVYLMAPSYSTDEGIDIRVPSLEAPGLFASLSFWSIALRLIKKEQAKFDLVIMEHPIFFDIEPLRHVRGILTYHGTYNGYAQAYRQFRLGRLGVYYRFAACLESKCLRELSRSGLDNIIVTGVSPSTLVELRSSGLSSDAYFVTNGLSECQTPSIGFVDRTLSSRITSIGGVSKRRILLYVGSGLDVSSKRSYLLPSLAEMMERSKPNVDLVMACGLPASVWKRRDNWPQNVHALGFVQRPKLEILFNTAVAYVSLSCYEGMPNSVMEAAVHGLPLILTDIPSHRWILSSGMGHGILIDPHRPLDDAERISKFLDSPQCTHRFPDSNIVEKYRWDSIAMEYLKLSGLR